MKILVTGGAGYIGYSLIEALVETWGDGLEEIVVYDNLSRANHALFFANRFGGAPIRFVNGEILDGRTLTRACEDVDIVYHLAAIVTTPNSDGDAHRFDQVNNWGTAQVATAIEESNRVKDVIHLSSTAVYGSNDDIRSAQLSKPEPSSVYGISKLRAEGQIARLGETRRTFIVRSGNVHGFNPAVRVEAVMNVMAFHAKLNGRVTIVGSGEQHRAFVEVRRLARRLAALPSSSLPPGIHDAVERNVSVLDIADCLRQLHPDLEFLFIDQDMRMRTLLVEVENEFLALTDAEVPPLEADLTALTAACSF